MKFETITLAAVGMGFLAFLATTTFNDGTLLKRVEPALVILSLVIVFVALQSTISDSAERPRNFRPKSILHEFQFSQHCTKRLGGEASFSGGVAYCKRGGFVTDTQRLAR